MSDWKAQLRSDLGELEHMEKAEQEKTERDHQNREERSARVKKFLRGTVESAFQAFKQELEAESQHSVQFRVTDYDAELRVDDGQLLVYMLRVESGALWVNCLHCGQEPPQKLAEVAALGKIDQGSVLQSLLSAFKWASESAIRELSGAD